MLEAPTDRATGGGRYGKEQANHCVLVKLTGSGFLQSDSLGCSIEAALREAPSYSPTPAPPCSLWLDLIAGQLLRDSERAGLQDEVSCNAEYWHSIMFKKQN